VRVAEQERSLAAWDHEAARLAVVTATTKAFVTALAAQERLALATDMQRLARDTAAAVERSVAAGAAAPVESTRARVVAARAAVESAQAERALDGARTLLAASWGEPRARFGHLEGSLAAVGTLPAEADLVAALERSPAIARWKTTRAARAAAAALERARRIPDVTVGAGGRHFSDNGDNALVFEVSLPLPVFDRNGAAVMAAREREAQAEDEAEAARVEARRALADAYLRLREARATARALADTLLPDARRTVADTVDAFRKGVLPTTDLLLARRTLMEIERERLDALERFHLAAADIERLTGAPLARTNEGDGR
jgi:cobalt-zinc-cadmium efflux system outer membrane protein